jgi:hypothetical protein
MQDFVIPDQNHFSLVTVFVVPRNSTEVTETWIREVVKQYEVDDDVFQLSFLSGCIFRFTAHGDIKIQSGVYQYLESIGNQWIQCIPSDISENAPVAGPQIIYQGRLREIWKLVDDTHGTFMTTLRPQSGSVIISLRC